MLIKLNKTEHIRTPSSAAKIIADIIAAGDKLDRDREQFYAIGLNTKNKIIFIELSTIGTLDQANPHPREIARRALTEGARSIIIAHNHPSGDPKPSQEDFIFTNRVRDGLKFLDIELTDHIILGELDTFYSFKETRTL